MYSIKIEEGRIINQNFLSDLIAFSAFSSWNTHYKQFTQRCVDKTTSLHELCWFIRSAKSALEWMSEPMAGDRNNGIKKRKETIINLCVGAYTVKRERGKLDEGTWGSVDSMQCLIQTVCRNKETRLSTERPVRRQARRNKNTPNGNSGTTSW